MDCSPLNITGFGKALQIKGSTLHRWYRDVLSDYAKDGGKSVHQHDVIIETGKKDKLLEVPILRANNFGANMTIDEKHIGEDFYTILANRDNGKIAFLSKTVVYSEIKEALKSVSNLTSGIKSITRDFSSLYEKVSSELFPNAIQIGDKFHIIRNLLDSHQAVRIRYRQKELEKRRKAYQEFKTDENQRLQESEKTGTLFKLRKFYYQEERLENGETPLEILARSRYLLYKYPEQWTNNQSKRASVLFTYYPEIKSSYELCCQFRTWLSKKNIGCQYLEIDQQLHQWYENVENAKIDELLNFKNMVETNEQVICNYFINGQTNAKAEAINSKIQKFISLNQGLRDKDFFFFRLANYYA
ncbi:MAG: transposase [Flavobacterium sp.]|nr:transposase [Flavobacterium sp.]